MKISIFAIVVLIGYVLGDEIIIKSPVKNEIVKSEKVNVEIEIVRNGMLYISNVTVELYDMIGKIDEKFSDTNNTLINLEMKTDIKNGQVKNYEIKVIGYGRYLAGQEIKYKNIETNVSVLVDTVSKTTTNKPSVNSSSIKSKTNLFMMASMILGMLVI